MMKARITKRMSSVVTVLAVSALLGTIVGVARAQDKPAGAQAGPKIVLSTAPSPAQKGTNTVMVKLSDPAGKPISGADVTVTFFMAAMPTMNMPEMKTVVKGTEKGVGMYEGKGDLGSGGIWDVTVTAKQNGQTIATRKLKVKAEGGA